MTDLDHLLRAVLADPDNVVVRLVLADACEERGDRAASRLRQPGYLELASGPLTTDPVTVYWVTCLRRHAVLGRIRWEEMPRCCGTYRAVLTGMGGWKCWQCAAREATRTGEGVWERLGVKQ